MYLDDVSEFMEEIHEKPGLVKQYLIALVHPDDLRDLRQELEDLGCSVSSWRADFNIQYNGWVISAYNNVKKGRIMYANVHCNQFCVKDRGGKSVVRKIANRLRALASEIEK